MVMPFGNMVKVREGPTLPKSFSNSNFILCFHQTSRSLENHQRSFLLSKNVPQYLQRLMAGKPNKSPIS